MKLIQQACLFISLSLKYFLLSLKKLWPGFKFQNKINKVNKNRKILRIEDMIWYFLWTGQLLKLGSHTAEEMESKKRMSTGILVFYNLYSI